MGIICYPAGVSRELIPGLRLGQVLAYLWSNEFDPAE